MRWLVAGCIGCVGGSVTDELSSDDSDDSDVIVEETVCEGSDWEASDLCTAWIRNAADEVAPVIKDASGGDVLVNVHSVEVVTESGADFVVITASGVPDYVVTLTEAHITALNDRPQAA